MIGFFLAGNFTFTEGKNTQSKPEFSNNEIVVEEKKIFELINKERNKYNLNDLNWNSDLADLARAYSKKMARENFFSHYDENGNSVSERAKAMKISKWKKIGENLFMSQGYEKFSQLAVKGWMRSQMHRQNILEANYNETGIGIAKSRNGTIYVTQVFLQK